MVSLRFYCSSLFVSQRLKVQFYTVLICSEVEAARFPGIRKVLAATENHAFRSTHMVKVSNHGTDTVDPNAPDKLILLVEVALAHGFLTEDSHLLPLAKGGFRIQGLERGVTIGAF